MRLSTAPGGAPAWGASHSDRPLPRHDDAGLERPGPAPVSAGRRARLGLDPVAHFELGATRSAQGASCGHSGGGAWGCFGPGRLPELLGAGDRTLRIGAALRTLRCTCLRPAAYAADGQPAELSL